MALPSFIAENVPLALMTTFRIGGPARLFASPSNRGEIGEALALAGDRRLPVLVLGGGSNLLVADAGVEAMVLRLSDAGEFAVMEREGEDVLRWRVGAAAPLAALVAACAREGADGLGFLAGIPGRVGGAAAMNAGGGGRGLGEFIREAEVYDVAGGGRSILNSELRFSYRISNIRDRLAVRFSLVLPNVRAPGELLEEAREHRRRKQASQPVTEASAGCVFRNPPGDSAGALLDRSGCKGMREGGAEVSAVHANFIVNRGGAGSGDVARLALRMRDVVFRKTGVALEPEVAVWGCEPAFGDLNDAMRR